MMFSECREWLLDFHFFFFFFFCGGGGGGGWSQKLDFSSYSPDTL